MLEYPNSLVSLKNKNQKKSEMYRVSKRSVYVVVQINKIKKKTFKRWE